MSPTMIGRFVALVMLALQLQPAVLSTLCKGASAARTTDCDQTMPQTHDGLAITGQQGQAPCVNAALCGIAQTANLASAFGTISVIESRNGPQLLRPVVHAIEAPAPPSPPPQA
jgi:hypothetical protein